MFLLSCVSEITGYCIGLIGPTYSKRNLLVLYLGLAAISSLPVAAIKPDNNNEISMNEIAIIFFASIAKMFASTSCYISYYYSSVIFPTSVRNTLVSFVSSFGRIGSILAPQINLLRFLIWKPLPYYIFTTTTAIGCLITMILPNDNYITHEI